MTQPGPEAARAKNLKVLRGQSRSFAFRYSLLKIPGDRDDLLPA